MDLPGVILLLWKCGAVSSRCLEWSFLFLCCFILLFVCVLCSSFWLLLWSCCLFFFCGCFLSVFRSLRVAVCFLYIRIGLCRLFIFYLYYVWKSMIACCICSNISCVVPRGAIILVWNVAFIGKNNFFEEKKQKKTDFCLVIMIFVIFVHR